MHVQSQGTRGWLWFVNGPFSISQNRFRPVRVPFLLLGRMIIGDHASCVDRQHQNDSLSQNEVTAKAAIRECGGDHPRRRSGTPAGPQAIPARPISAGSQRVPVGDFLPAESAWRASGDWPLDRLGRSWHRLCAGVDGRHAASSRLRKVRGVDFRIGLGVGWNKKDQTAGRDEIIDIARSLARSGR